MSGEAAARWDRASRPIRWFCSSLPDDDPDSSIQQVASKSRSCSRIMTQRTIAIGDIHGCAAALEAVLQEIRPSANDRIVTLGDYIDRGSNSRGVIEQLLQLRERCELVPLIGNHELMLLRGRVHADERDFWLEFGGRATIASYGASLSDIPRQHIDFMESCLPFYETESHIFIHANYDAETPLEEQLEITALWTHISGYVPEPHCSGKTVIVGHTPQPDGEIRDWGHVICIDTCCFGGGWLTALDVNSKDVWQADKDGNLRDL